MSKSKGERGKTPTSGQNAPAASPTAIIPGKFMEADWNRLVQDEASEEFIYQIVNEIVACACNAIYNKVIESRVRPYAVSAARKLLLELVQWQFLTCDEGELDTFGNESWIEDEEPATIRTDSWAQGAVPLRDLPVEHVAANVNGDPINDDSSHQRKDSDPDSGHSEKDASDSVDEDASSQCNERSGPDGQASFAESDTDMNNNKSAGTELSIAPEPPKKPQAYGQRRPVKFKPYRGKLPGFPSMSPGPLSPANSSDHESRLNMDQSSSGIPPHSVLMMLNRGDVKDMVYNEKGQAVAISKLDLNKLPSHRIRTGYSIVDPTQDSSWSMSSFHSDQTSSPASSKHNQTTSSVMMSNRSDKKLKDHVVDASSAVGQFYSVDSGVIHGVKTPLPPPLLDSIDVVSSGVVVREGGLVKKGPKQRGYEHEETAHLRPLGTASPTRLLTAKDVIGQSSPVVRPFVTSEPLPSILSTCK